MNVFKTLFWVAATIAIKGADAASNLRGNDVAGTDKDQLLGGHQGLSFSQQGWHPEGTYQKEDKDAYIAVNGLERELSATGCSNIDVIAAVDLSGTQVPTLPDLKSAVSTLASNVIENDGRVGIVSFNVYGKNLLPLGSSESQMFGAVASMTAGGGTQLRKAFEVIINNQLALRDPARELMIVIPSDFVDDFPAEAKALGAVIKENGNVKFKCIRIGNYKGQANQDLVNTLCVAPEDIYDYPDVPSFANAAGDIAKNLCKPIATQAPVTQAPTAKPTKQPTTKSPTKPVSPVVTPPPRATAQPTTSPTANSTVIGGADKKDDFPWWILVLAIPVWRRRKGNRAAQETLQPEDLTAMAAAVKDLPKEVLQELPVEPPADFKDVLKSVPGGTTVDMFKHGASMFSSGVDRREAVKPREWHTEKVPKTSSNNTAIVKQADLEAKPEPKKEPVSSAPLVVENQGNGKECLVSLLPLALAGYWFSTTERKFKHVPVKENIKLLDICGFTKDGEPNPPKGNVTAPKSGR